MRANRANRLNKIIQRVSIVLILISTAAIGGAEIAHSESSPVISVQIKGEFK